MTPRTALAAVASAAAALALATTGTAVAAAAPATARPHVSSAHRAVDAARLPSSLSIHPGDLQRAGGGTVVVGRLHSHRAPIRYRQVLLLVHRANTTSWAPVQAKRTSSTGRVRFAVGTAAGASYRLVFLGDRTFRPARSRVVRDAGHAALSIWGTPADIDAGAPATVGGVLTVGGAPAAGRSVTLLAHNVRTSYGWKAVGRGTTAANGTVTFVVTPRASMRYRLVAPRSAGQAAARSATTVVSVRNATALRIHGKAVATGYAVTGRLVSRGYAVRGKAVILQQRQADGSWASIDSRLSGRRGQVRFVEPLQSGATYQLLFVGTGAWATSTSPTLSQP